MKQYNLLRPIALNELIVGMQILFVSNQQGRPEQLETVVALANEQNFFVTQNKNGTYYIVPIVYYYHNPLAWIEDKPVYEGDVLWYKRGKWSMKITGYNQRAYPANTGFEGIIIKGDDIYNIKGEKSWAPIDNWTWIAPSKEKKQAWINIYPLNEELMRRYDSKQDALYGKGSQCINTIQIEWEE